MHTQRAQGGWFTWADTPRMTLLDVAALLWAERMLIVMDIEALLSSDEIGLVRSAAHR